MEALAALDLAVALLSRGLQISQLVRNAQSEGRTHLTDAEWATVTGADNDARAALVAAIESARAKVSVGNNPPV